MLVLHSEHAYTLGGGGTTTSSFLVSNGVKQGGIQSPILFNVYIYGLSVKLNAYNAREANGSMSGNSLCYADDVYFISLSPACIIL